MISNLITALANFSSTFYTPYSFFSDNVLVTSKGRTGHYNLVTLLCVPRTLSTVSLSCLPGTLPGTLPDTLPGT